MELANPGSAESQPWLCWVLCPIACAVSCAVIGHFIAGVTAHLAIHSEEAH